MKAGDWAELSVASSCAPSGVQGVETSLLAQTQEGEGQMEVGVQNLGP